MEEYRLEIKKVFFVCFFHPQELKMLADSCKDPSGLMFGGPAQPA